MPNPVCISPLKFYDSIAKQSHRKSYAYGHISPLITKTGQIPPFQFVVPKSLYQQPFSIVNSPYKVYNAKTKQVVSTFSPELVYINEYYVVISKEQHIYGTDVQEGFYYIETSLGLYCSTYYFFKRDVGKFQQEDTVGFSEMKGPGAGEPGTIVLYQQLTDKYLRYNSGNNSSSFYYKKFCDYNNQTSLRRPLRVSIRWNPGNSTGRTGNFNRLVVGNIEIGVYGQDKTASIYHISESGREENINKNNLQATQDDVREPQNPWTIDLMFYGNGTVGYTVIKSTQSMITGTISSQNNDFDGTIGLGFERGDGRTADAYHYITQLYIYESDILIPIKPFYSEIFCFSSVTKDCIELEYWNETGNFAVKNGVIAFPDNFHFKLLLKGEIGKPEYNFEEESTKRLGYTFVESQVSKKIYKFNVIVPEYICDALRIVRLCDNKIIRCKDDEYEAITFEMEAEWQTQGDLASVTCEFETDNVVANIGGFIPDKLGGDYNNDYNEDFDKE